MAAFSPIHHDGELLGFTATRIHWLDLKQKDAGYVLDSTDMHQEGIFFPCTKIERRGVLQEDIVNLIKFNSRYPEQTVGDMRAQIAACRTGERRVERRSSSASARTSSSGLRADPGPRRAAGPRGPRRSCPRAPGPRHDFVDDDGIDERLVRMECTVTISDDEMVVDWCASRPAGQGPHQPALRHDAGALQPHLQGAHHAGDAGHRGQLPAAPGHRTRGQPDARLPPAPTFTLWTGLLAGEVITKALSQGMPDLVPACSGGDVCSMMGLGLDPRTGRYWLEATNEAVGFGGHVGGDGESGIMHLSEPGCRNNPVEVLEVKSPMLIEHYGLRPDSGGPGEHRGGLGVSRVYRFLAPSTAITLVKKTRTRAVGHGGRRDRRQLPRDPAPGHGRAAGHRRRVRGDGRRRGARQQLRWWRRLGRSRSGAPSTAVLEDVREGYVSPERARNDYGVVIDVAAMAVDEAATAALRASRGA